MFPITPSRKIAPPGKIMPPGKGIACCICSLLAALLFFPSTCPAEPPRDRAVRLTGDGFVPLPPQPSVMPGQWDTNPWHPALVSPHALPRGAHGELLLPPVSGSFRWGYFGAQPRRRTMIGASRSYTGAHRRWTFSSGR